MPEEYKLYCKEHQIKYIEHTEFTEEIIADADILYMTRVQRERFTDLMEYERVKNVYILRKMLENTRPAASATAPAAPCQRDCLRRGQQPESILFPTGAKRSVCP